jgi:hypothetical protein
MDLAEFANNKATKLRLHFRASLPSTQIEQSVMQSTLAGTLLNAGACILTVERLSGTLLNTGVCILTVEHSAA